MGGGGGGVGGGDERGEYLPITAYLPGVDAFLGHGWSARREGGSSFGWSGQALVGVAGHMRLVSRLS